MRYLSLFSGIEAASVAWHPIGWECAAVSEIEPFPCAVLAHRYPGVPNLGDVTKVTEAQIAALGQIDLVVFGSPCQDLSVAGKRKGLAGARSGLFFTAMQIIEWARLWCGCRFALWENVPGAFSSNKGADFAAVVDALSGVDDTPVPPKGWGTEGCAVGPEAMVEWAVLDAQWFGVAQRRRRVFALADFGNWAGRPPVLLEPDRLRGDSAPSREAREVAPTIPSRSTAGGGLGTDFDCGGGLIAAGNAEGSTGLPFLTCSNIGKTVNNQTPLMAFTSAQPLPFDTTQVTSAANRSVPKHGDPCHPLAAGAHAPAIAIQAGAIKTNPNIGPDGVGIRTDDCAYTLEARAEVQAIAFHGSQDPDVSGDVTHPVGRNQGQETCVAFSAKDYGADASSISPTLRAMGHSDSHANGGGQVAVAFQSSQSGVRVGDTHATLDANNGPRRHNGALICMQVRRLTPRECERLQGFPDDYTDIPWTEYQRIQKQAAKTGSSFEAELKKRGKVLRGPHTPACPDGPRYKALGNSMAVPVMRWIGKSIDAALLFQED